MNSTVLKQIYSTPNTAWISFVKRKEHTWQRVISNKFIVNFIHCTKQAVLQVSDFTGVGNRQSRKLFHTDRIFNWETKTKKNTKKKLMKHKYIHMQHLLSVVPHFSIAKVNIPTNKWFTPALWRLPRLPLCWPEPLPGLPHLKRPSVLTGLSRGSLSPPTKKKKKTWHSWHLVHIHYNLDTGENSIHNSWHYKRSHQLGQVSYRSENFNILKQVRKLIFALKINAAAATWATF